MKILQIELLDFGLVEPRLSRRPSWRYIKDDLTHTHTHTPHADTPTHTFSYMLPFSELHLHLTPNTHPHTHTHLHPSHSHTHPHTYTPTYTPTHPRHSLKSRCLSTSSHCTVSLTLRDVLLIISYLIFNNQIWFKKLFNHQILQLSLDRERFCC